MVKQELSCLSRMLPPLTAAIDQMLQRPQEWAAMGGRARQHIVENFNNRIIIQRLCSFYATVETKCSRTKR